MSRARRVASIFSGHYPYALVYMAQSCEYGALEYLKWFWSLPDFKNIESRGQLKKTKVAKLLLGFVFLGIFIQLALGMLVILLSLNGYSPLSVIYGAAIFITYPLVWAHLLVMPMFLGKKFYIEPLERRIFLEAKEIFHSHKGTIIAVAGSYGKTTMKELLKTVTCEGKKVAATPANKNVLRSVAAFSKTLSGEEDVVIVEFGEAKPGDIEMFCRLTGPDTGVITGIAPAHLGGYKTLDEVRKDIFTLSNYVDSQNLYVSQQAVEAEEFEGSNFITYSASGVGDWRASNIKLSIEATELKLSKAKTKLSIKTGLLGRHQIGPISAAVSIASQVGLTPKQIEKGVSNTKPYQHRMEPRHINGYWIIDDSYNGNIEGVKAGTQLLKDLKAKRKIYVTPGLVEQGPETKNMHILIGEYIAGAGIDTCVLMHNSTTDYIKQGLEQSEFKGELVIETNPLAFYQNIDQFLAAGDIALLQNDWTDNYR